jgi:hypothetical protein
VCTRYTRYVVYSAKFGYYCPANNKSLSYSKDDFVTDLEKAKKWANKDTAQNMAIKLFRDWNTSCVSISVSIDVLDVTPTEEILASELEACEQIIKSVETLGDKDVEKLADCKWREYLSAKTYVSAYGPVDSTE